MHTPSLTSALEYFNTNRTLFRDELKQLCRIPSISFPGFDSGPVLQCADAVAALLRRTRLTDVRLLTADKGYPAVFGQWTGKPGNPTILLYAHYDVQPTGREPLWVSLPFEPAERNNRLYCRGAADDKGGVVMHAAAVASYLASAAELPVNVKVLIEGEEEIGSSNLELILKRHRDLLAADVVLIADSENLENGVPTLTASLRGIVTVAVEVRSLGSSVHSGTWGGPLPDPVIALSRMIASLADEEGRPAVPGIQDEVRPLTPAERASFEALPFDDSLFRKQSSLLDGVKVIGGPGSAYEKMWRRPSIAVNAFEASSRKQAANIVNDTAWARIGIRIVPDMDPEKTLRLLTEHLLRQAPWGVQVKIEPESPAPWWRTDTDGPMFEAALRALERGYGKKPAIVGAGGSIPFVRTMTDALGGVPALLFGVGDPYTAGHSENESLPLADWENGCRSLIHLFAEMGGSR